MAENRPHDRDDEIVPLGQIRPAREAFGPIPRNAASKGVRNAATKGTGRPQVSGQQRRPRPADAKPASRNSNANGRPQNGGSAPERRPQSNEVRGQNRPQARRSEVQRVEQDRRPVRRPRDTFADDLSTNDRQPAVQHPSSGWRGILVKATGGAVNPGPGAGERRDAELRHRLRRPLTDGTVAVFSRKGGVGKTTISAYLGLTLAEERGGRIVALDGDAEAGSLGWLLAPEARSTLADLASANPTPSDYASLRRYTTSTPEGLEVIIGEPAEMGPISTVGLESVADQLARHYDVSIFDTGAGVTRATGRVLVNSARVLLLVMGPSVDSVRAAERTLAWIEERPGEAANADVRVIAVINGIPTGGKQSQIDQIESHFANRCSAVVRIPWDAHLAAGNSSVSLDKLAKPTRRAFMELAATTVSTLARPARRPNAVGARRAS